MKYYTKEWYNLMQRFDYTLNAKKIPEKVYSKDLELLEEGDFDPEEWILLVEENFRAKEI